MRIVRNAGEVFLTKVGHFVGYSAVLYHLHAIANILSLSRVQRQLKMTHKSEEGELFKPQKLDGRTPSFHSTSTGLYESQFISQGNAIGLVKKVAENIK